MNRFGIEMEFVGLGNDTRRLADRLNSSVRDNEFSNYYQIPFIARQGNGTYANQTWALKTDGSVHQICLRSQSSQTSCGFCENCVNFNGCELVSPPMNYNQESFDKIHIVCESLNRLGAKVNRTCGLHVHIDTLWLRTFGQSRQSEFLNYMWDSYCNDEDIFDSLVNEDRRGDRNEYCHTLKNRRNCMEVRYHKLNVVAYAQHGTIEFRHHHGSVNADEITSWVKNCMTYYRNKVEEFAIEHGTQDFYNQVPAVIPF